MSDKSLTRQHLNLLQVKCRCSCLLWLQIYRVRSQEYISCSETWITYVCLNFCVPQRYVSLRKDLLRVKRYQQRQLPSHSVSLAKTSQYRPTRLLDIRTKDRNSTQLSERVANACYEYLGQVVHKCCEQGVVNLSSSHNSY